MPTWLKSTHKNRPFPSVEQGFRRVAWADKRPTFPNRLSTLKKGETSSGFLLSGQLAQQTPAPNLLPKQPEVNIGTSGHVDHGKCYGGTSTSY